MMVEIVQLQTYTMHYWHTDEAFLKSLFDRLIYIPQCKGMGRPSSLINLLQSDLYQQGLKIRLISWWSALIVADNLSGFDIKLTRLCQKC